MKQRVPYDFPLHMIFGQNYLWMFTHYSSPMVSITAHTWTLSIDFWLSVVWTVSIFRLLANHSTKSLTVFSLAMITIAISWREAGALMGLDDMYIACCPIAHADAFGIGTLIAVNAHKWPKRYIFIMGAIGFIGILVTIHILADMTQCSYMDAYSLVKKSSLYLTDVVTCNLYLYITLFTGAIFIILLDLKPAINSRNWFVQIGNISYELYLFHWPVYVILHRLITNPYLKAIAVFVLTFVIVWIFKTAEKHLLKGKV